MHFNSNIPHYWQWQRILSKIHNETGWDYKEVAERVYYINHHFEQAPRLAFDLFAASAAGYLDFFFLFNFNSKTEAVPRLAFVTFL